MVLSVIIVHYQTPYFLELCLLSVEKALQGLDAEILVVDNHSADGIPDFLTARFPRVKWILNAENLGFARANNLGLASATGEYILFLNPDTILPEDFARSCLAFFQKASGGQGGAEAPAASGAPGAIGVRMIDGSGRFLKESRRGVPTPWVALYKLTGLTALFPRSRRFAKYYLGYWPSDRTHPAPILSGACLLVARAALDAVGPFDESFFMYAEDIDLSYRLEKAGYRNYYYADCTIVHFKGASTEKDLRYIRQFYKAMSQFRRKHFNSGVPGFFRVAVEAGIRLRGALDAVGKTFVRVPRPPAATPTGPVRLVGDPEAIAALRLRLPASIRVTADAAQVREIVFCAGAGFSFRDLIAALQKMERGKTAWIYAAGSHAMISSPRRDNKGSVGIL